MLRRNLSLCGAKTAPQKGRSMKKFFSMLLCVSAAALLCACSAAAPASGKPYEGQFVGEVQLVDTGAITVMNDDGVTVRFNTDGVVLPADLVNGDVVEVSFVGTVTSADSSACRVTRVQLMSVSPETHKAAEAESASAA